MSNTMEIRADMPWLAPLAGWTDLPFRLLCRDEGAAVTCTEMISAKGLYYGGKNTQDLLLRSPKDEPVVAQIFGAEYDFMEKGIGVLQGQGFRYFDVNVGCSVPKVVKTGAGAAMLKDIPNLLEVAEHVIRQVHNPRVLDADKNLTSEFDSTVQAGKIGFKIRLGYEMHKDVYLELGKELENLGADWVTLHPRYAKQGFTGEARHEALAELKSELSIPVIASGDLFSAKDGVCLLLKHKVDTVMYARGAMSNPFIFAEHTSLYQKAIEENFSPAECAEYAEEISMLSSEEQKDKLKKLILKHLELAMQYHPYRALLQMRTVVPRYVKHFENAKSIRLALIDCKSHERLVEIIENM